MSEIIEKTPDQLYNEQRIREQTSRSSVMPKFEKKPNEQVDNKEDDGVYFDPNAGEEKIVVDLKKDEQKVESPKLNLSRFKEFIGKDPETEDEIESAWKKDREELRSAKMLAQGRKALDEDKEYQSQIWWATKADDETLVKEGLSYQYQVNGLSKAEADKKAEERIKAQVESNKFWLEDQALSLRNGLKGTISQRESKFMEDLQKASEGVSFINPNEKLENQVQEALNSMDEFLGMKIRKEDKEKLMKEANIPTSEIIEALKDPKFLAKVKYLKKFEKQLTANIVSRNNGKASILAKLPTQPSAGTGFSQRNKQVQKQESGQRPKFNPASLTQPIA